MTDYNLGVALLELHGNAYSGHAQSQQKRAQTVTVLNGVLRDISDLTNLLTQNLSSGIANLGLNKELIERIRNRDPNLLLDAGNCMWNTAEKIKTQLELLKESAQHGSQQMNLEYTKMNQAEKDWTEVNQIFFNSMQSWRDLMKSFLRLFG